MHCLDVETEWTEAISRVKDSEPNQFHPSK